MGRELKRVPLDFAQPLNEPWDGYLNPHYKECGHCKSGYSRSYDTVAKHVNALMWDRATKTDANVSAITTFLSGRAPDRSLFGHDSIDAWSAVKKLGELAGLPEDWARCASCKGSGVDAAHQVAYEAWERTEPPEGLGYQIWETVSEGSPITPVFATPEELARYAADHPWGAGGGNYDSWLRFINGPGWAPSMVMDAAGVHAGADAAFINDKP